MMTTRPPRFVSVTHQDRLGRLLFAGRAENARLGGGISGDGLWRERDRDDGGTLFLLVDIEGKGPDTAPLLEVIELALDDEATWNLPPSELIVELHAQGAAAWADAPRQHQKYFHAQAVLVLPERGHFLLASAGIPSPYHAGTAGDWQVIDAPRESIAMLGRPDLHDESGPVFPDRRVDLGQQGDYLACTDGITDLGRKDGLRPAAVVTFLNNQGDRPDPHALLERVFALAAQHDGTAWPSDDTTGVAWRLS